MVGRGRRGEGPRGRVFSSRGRCLLVVASSLATMVVLAGASGSTVPAGAVANAPGAPAEATTFQNNPLHDGFSVDPGFSAPLGLAWSTPLSGRAGYPVIADGRVFVMLERPDDSGNHVQAFSLSTGEVLWGPVAVGGGPFQEGMIAYDQGRVFAINFYGQLTALDAATGERAWRKQMQGQHAFTSAPTAVAGTLYLAGSGSGSTLYAVDEVTGDTRWASHVVAAGDHTAPVVDTTGIYLSGACQQTFRYGLDGTFLWRRDTGCTGGGGRTAVLHDGLLYVRDPSDFPPPAVLDAETGRPVGSFDSDLAPAFDYDDHIATVTDGVLSISTTTAGSPSSPIWRSASSDFVTAPLIVNQYVVAGRRDGAVEVRDIDDGAVAWRGVLGTQNSPSNEGGGSTLTGLAQGGGALVVPAGSTLNVFTPTTNATVEITGGPAPGSVVGASTTFTFASDLGGVQFACTTDDRTEPCSSPHALSGLADGPHDFAVAVVGSQRAAAATSFVTDALAPAVRLEPFPSKRIRSRFVRARWTATDARSGVLAYQLQVRRGRIGEPWPPWTTEPPSSATSADLRLRRGTRLCVAVRAVDHVLAWSDWSAPQCVSRRRDNHR